MSDFIHGIDVIDLNFDTSIDYLPDQDLYQKHFNAILITNDWIDDSDDLRLKITVTMDSNGKVVHHSYYWPDGLPTEASVRGIDALEMGDIMDSYLTGYNVPRYGTSPTSLDVLYERAQLCFNSFKAQQSKNQEKDESVRLATDTPVEFLFVMNDADFAAGSRIEKDNDQQPSITFHGELLASLLDEKGQTPKDGMTYRIPIVLTAHLDNQNGDIRSFDVEYKQWDGFPAFEDTLTEQSTILAIENGRPISQNKTLAHFLKLPLPNILHKHLETNKTDTGALLNFDGYSSFTPSERNFMQIQCSSTPDGQARVRTRLNRTNGMNLLEQCAKMSFYHALVLERDKDPYLELEQDTHNLITRRCDTQTLNQIVQCRDAMHEAWEVFQQEQSDKFVKAHGKQR